MTCARNGSYYQLRLARGEEIVATLVDFARRRRLKSAFLTGIGAGEDLVLGCFDPARRAYNQRTFRGDHEIAALVGNIAWDGPAPARARKGARADAGGGQPICHIHAIISAPDLTTFAGHLFSGRVTVTCEVAVVPGSSRLMRRPDPATGLKLLELPVDGPS